MLIATLALVALAVPQSDRTKAPIPTREDFLADIAELKQIVRTKWSYLEMRKLDLDALEKLAIAELGAKPVINDFDRALRRFVAEMRDGHSGVIVKGSNVRGWRPWPFSVVDVREGIMVDGVTAEFAKTDRLSRGDLILKIDGVDVDRCIKNEERYAFGSVPGARRVAAIKQLFSYSFAKKLRLSVHRLGQAEPKDVEIQTLTSPPKFEKPGVLPRTRAHKMLDAKTAWFRVGSFRTPDQSKYSPASSRERKKMIDGSFAEFAAIITKYQSVENLIIDLRHNPGGTDLLGQALACHLLAPGFGYFKLGAQRKGRWFANSPVIRPSVGRQKPRYTGRIICLIDAKTFSVADNFSACLRDQHPNVHFVGRATGAGTGAPRAFTLPKTGARVYFCTMRVWSPKGRMIEGTGTAPDTEVIWTRADHLAGRDPDLEMAKSILRAKAKKKKTQ